MKAFGLMTVFRTLPARISRLHELAYNLWWSWHPEACTLYSSIDPDLWEEVGHNPVRFLGEVQPPCFEQAAEDKYYLHRYESVISDFDGYMHPRETWFAQTYPELTDRTIAYFSAEFGLSEALPIYSGGLGLLSGDLCKYGGDRETRISQEILLGIGGVRALHALGISPDAWHLNEGHAAFLNLERCRELVASGLNFNIAREVVIANSLFTTHTPVSASNDTFDFDLIDKYFWTYWGQLGLTRDQFMELAREDHGWGPGYGMTVLALRLTGQHNGVSELHGAVSRKMWHFLWPNLDEDEVPIGSITNGIHTATWIVPEMSALSKRYLGEDWESYVDEAAFWNRISEIPDEALWETHQRRKDALIDYARGHLKQQQQREGEGVNQSDDFGHVLNPAALTIGFARRFATYKRATLILRDLDRLSRILNNPKRPVQIIFAGKAHPADGPGKALIEQIYRISHSDPFRGKIIFLENYDIEMARYLVSGTDLWLNNPVRPYEASGTSGQKAALNGLPNCSILDGWWAEGYDGENGWAIGEAREYDSPDARDDADSRYLYELLEEEIIPIYYHRGPDGIPHAWVAITKEAIRTCVACPPST